MRFHAVWCMWTKIMVRNIMYGISSLCLWDCYYVDENISVTSYIFNIYCITMYTTAVRSVCCKWREYLSDNIRKWPASTAAPVLIGAGRSANRMPQASWCSMQRQDRVDIRILLYNKTISVNTAYQHVDKDSVSVRTPLCCWGGNFRNDEWHRHIQYSNPRRCDAYSCTWLTRLVCSLSNV